MKVAPNLKDQKVKHLRLAIKFGFQIELEAILEEKYFSMNISYEIIRLAAQQLQETAKYEDFWHRGVSAMLNHMISGVGMRYPFHQSTLPCVKKSAERAK